MPDVDTCLAYESASKLPILNATIKEILRYYSAVPGPLPRYVPAGDGLLVDDKYVIPAGTQVSLQAYTVHRNRSIYGDDADEFNPDRWLVSGICRLKSLALMARFFQRDPESADMMYKNVSSGFDSLLLAILIKYTCSS